MSKINDLIKKLCPKGVKYYLLADLEDNNKIILGRGNVISKSDIRENPGDYPVYSSSAVGNGEIGRYGKYMFEDVRISWSIDGGGRFFYRNAPKYSITNVSGWLKVLDDSFIDAKYLYYSLTNEWTKKTYDYTHKAHPSVIRKEYIIPIPPLEVQKEIVSILDKFGELEAELEAELEVELEARKSQYEFWRGKLLDKNDNLKSIGELFEFKNGINKSKDCFGTGNLIINYVDVYKNNKITNEIVKGLVELNDTDLIRYSCKCGDVFFTRTSETREEVGIASVLVDDMNDSVFSGFLLRARPITDLLIPEYCAYCFSSPRVRRDIISYANFTTRATVTGPILSKVKIYVPSKEEQKRIVNVLDKMYYLINSFIDGIPAEIELRRKQYEYYRNKLVSFEELSVSE